MKNILAIINKPKKEFGGDKYWVGYLFNTPVQSMVETFMCLINTPNYFLVNPDLLETDDVKNPIFKNLVVICNCVKVNRKSFTIY
jgi:hypothetical protein